MMECDIHVRKDAHDEMGGGMQCNEDMSARKQCEAPMETFEKHKSNKV